MAEYIQTRMESDVHIQTRVWAIVNQNDLTTADCKWLTGLGVACTVKQENHPFVFNGRQLYMPGRVNIEVRSTTDKQKDMLYLKYGDDLVLMALYYNPTEYIPHSL